MNKGVNILAANSSYYKSAEAQLMGLSEYVSLTDDEFDGLLSRIWDEAIRSVRTALNNEPVDELAMKAPGHNMVKAFERRFPELKGRVRWNDARKMFYPKEARRTGRLDTRKYLLAEEWGCHNYEVVIRLNEMWADR